MEKGRTEGSRKTAQEKTPTGSVENRSSRRRAEHKEYVWSYDLVIDRIEDGCNLKLMPGVDEHPWGVYSPCDSP